MTLRSQTELRRVAGVNPVRDPSALDPSGVIGDEILASVVAAPRRLESRRAARRSGLRTLTFVAAMILAVLAPAVAIATQHGLFDATKGEPIDRGELSLSDLSAVDESGFTGEIRRIGERAGVAFFVAAGRDGGLCFATGAASRGTPKLDHFVGCQRPSANAFPSPDEPILDLSPLKSPNPRELVYVQRLVGFAADGVARVGFIDTTGIVHSTVVVDNVYATPTFSVDRAATAIVALDARGDIVYRKPLLLTAPARATR